MTEWLLPLGVTAASLSMTYFFCLRPMRKGHCRAGGQQQQQVNRPEQLERDLNRARTELDSLRTENSTPTPSRPLPGHQ